MSSNKSAEELVGILNDLFERFDDLCVLNGCEKISTLGDCYYCVSGCPEPKADHAKACVAMGLGMIEAIQQFDSERNEGVNMRVGVHTGTVLCGIVGTKRFKFDVWSNDVTLANQMESTGKPGRVHVSHATRQFLGDTYHLEEGELIYDLKTYFIQGRKSDPTILEGDKVEFREKHDYSSLQTGVVAPPPPLALAPLQRQRVSSCNQSQKPKRSHYLQLLTSPPTNQVKACSMPSILDLDNEVEDGEQGGGRLADQDVKSPLCSASCGKFMSPSKGTAIWTYPGRFQSQSDGLVSVRARGDSMQDVSSRSVMSQLNVPLPNEDRLSVCRSTNSRKDSGIRSNSRRSSIQQQIFLLNGIAQGEMLTNRVSGYYTSSQSSFDNIEDPDIRRSHLPPPLGDNFGACFQKLRKQSDLQLIRCVQDNVTSHRSYFVKPPLSDLSLFFRQSEMEREYRTNAHRVSEKQSSSPPTLATSTFNTYLDVLISALVYSAVSISLFLLYDVTLLWIATYVLATTLQVFAVFLCLHQLFNSRYALHISKDCPRRILDKFSSWYPWHVCGAILVSLPVLSVLINFSCWRVFDRSSNYYYSYLLFIGLVHFCNFTQLNCWMKSIMASIAGIMYVILVASQTCNVGPLSVLNLNESSLNINSSVPLSDVNVDMFSFENLTDISVNAPARVSRQISEGAFHLSDVDFFQNPFNISALDNDTGITTLNTTILATVMSSSFYKAEIFVDVLLLLILVWFLNREFEISYRLSFHSNFVAARDKARVQSMKNQADWLLHNIIPKHVADQLKNTAKYSENHKDVGIIFASIVNFNEMYDESYLGGKEYLRVLNELIGDFDELLTKPEFSNVEKIKTIGSTFMAASGLNPEVRRQSKYSNQHLYELMEFAVALQRVVDDFNRDLLEFTLILRIGFNFGDVTAGVIGTSKLYYDIWGDAVNIASRMDSTGVRGRIQVGVACVQVLSEWFDFEPRGSVYVKGKDNMDVFLLKGKRGGVFDDG